MLNKNILIVLPFSFYRNSGSAFSSYFRVKALLEINGKADVVCYPHGEDLEEQGLRLFRYPKYLKFKDYEPGQWKKKVYYDFIITLTTAFLLFRKKYDVIFVHGTLIYFFALFSWMMPKRIYIATLHANVDGEFEKWGVSNSSLLKRLVLKIELICLKRYNKIIVVSKTVKDRLVEKGCSPNKFFVINNSVFSCQLKSKINESKNFVVLYTGTFVKIQNLELIYQTALILSDYPVHFYLVGATKEELDRDTNYIQTLGLNNVTLFPRVPHEELEKFYSECDIVITPRVYGNEIPMKIYDYINYGKCILAADAPIHRSILTNDVAWLVEGKADNFAEAIKHLHTHPDVRLNLEKQAKCFFENNFSFEMMKDKYNNIFNS